MKRDPQKLVDTEYDLLVIGAGINGACIARDAALRGMKVAVVDQGDFGAATSFNSLRTVHGGLRYVQHLDFKRMRESIRERSTWLRVAPHLVHPLPCMAATFGRGLRSRTAFRGAFLINDLVGFDRNRGLPSERSLPGSRVVSQAEALKHYHGRDRDRITGGALWYDAQMYHSERLVLAVLFDAAEAGADIVNYVPVSAVHVQRGKVVGAEAFDALGGGTLAIRARCVVNASGPAIARLVASATRRSVDRPIVPLSKAMNLLTKRIAGEVAIGVPSRHEDPNAKVKHGERLWFIAPWRDLSLIGTTHEAFDDKPENFRVTEDEVAGFVDEINEACPRANLTLDDVRFVYAGLLPSAGPGGAHGEVRLLQHHKIIDHAREDAIEGLISLVGVKYTTSRLAAQQVVDRVCVKLGRSTGRCLTGQRPIFGSVSQPIDQFSASELKASNDTGLPPEQLAKLIRLYGARYREVLAHGDDDECREDHNLLAAEVRYAVRQQMAATLGDVVFRRTDLASRGHPGAKVLRAAAEVMAAECGWDDERRSAELAEVEEIFGAWRSDKGYRPTGLAPPADDRAAHDRTDSGGIQGSLSDGRVLSAQQERGS